MTYDEDRCPVCGDDGLGDDWDETDCFFCVASDWPLDVDGDVGTSLPYDSAVAEGQHP